MLKEISNGLMQLAEKGLSRPNIVKYLCSDNFNQNDFEKNCGGSYLLKLKATAVPSTFPNYSDIISKAKIQCLEVDQFQVAGCSSYIPCTEINEPGNL